MSNANEANEANEAEAEYPGEGETRSSDALVRRSARHPQSRRGESCQRPRLSDKMGYIHCCIADKGGTNLAQRFEAHEETFGDMYARYLRGVHREQQEVAERLHEASPGRGAGTWDVRLTKIRNHGIHPTTEEIYLVSHELGVSRFDETRLLRAADIYPTDEEFRLAIESVETYAQRFPWPACFLDYRMGILGWSDRFAVAFGANAPVAGRPAPVNSFSVRQNLLQSLFDPRGFLHPLLDDDHAPYADAIRLTTLIWSYWKPLTVWPNQRSRVSWQREVERSCRNFPRFAQIWDQANNEYGMHERGPYSAFSTTPLYNQVVMDLQGQVYRLLFSMLTVDARIEVLEFQPLAPPANDSEETAPEQAD